MSVSTIKVRKIGCRFHPPALILFYIDLKTNKTRRRTHPIENLSVNTNVTDYARELQESETNKSNLFKFIPLRRLERLIFVLKNGSCKNQPISTIKNHLESYDRLDLDEDLNKLDDDTLKHKKSIMNELFEKNLVTKEDKNYKYDIDVDFTTNQQLQASEWDSDNEDDE
ncbi:unnamed protein product [Didymodactylos carnosus]|uniref:Centrosomal protein of 19 kDa n=1 Tax=Didymodactylos carnosus TaxID=1234261 RepID=A0A813W2M9_9BILA|nr:unnamed protein product [Didymodactylos carnosus]CAF1088000.1 unnamed protein product [Didymodactylos carnosus]CAF3633077.1 unnamed protein product [Didymodactylos carnosus]CAF3849776.1 unnamed protein product [Didymodactylos carnosus]